MICAVALREGERLFWNFGILVLCTISGVWQVGPGFLSLTLIRNVPPSEESSSNGSRVLEAIDVTCYNRQSRLCRHALR